MSLFVDKELELEVALMSVEWMFARESMNARMWQDKSSALWESMAEEMVSGPLDWEKRTAEAIEDEL